MLCIGDFIKILEDPQYDFWNNTYSEIDEEKLPIYKVHQISHNLIKKTYRLALENINKKSSVDYYTVKEELIKVLPTTKDGEPYSLILLSGNSKPTLS